MFTLRNTILLALLSIGVSASPVHSELAAGLIKRQVFVGVSRR